MKYETTATENTILIFCTLKDGYWAKVYFLKYLKYANILVEYPFKMTTALIGCALSLLASDWMNPSQTLLCFLIYNLDQKTDVKWKLMYLIFTSVILHQYFSDTAVIIPVHSSSLTLFPALDLYMSKKKLFHCFMLALWPWAARGPAEPTFILFRVNCSDRALRGPSLARCPALRGKEAALIPLSSSICLQRHYFNSILLLASSRMRSLVTMLIDGRGLSRGIIIGLEGIWKTWMIWDKM